LRFLLDTMKTMAYLRVSTLDQDIEKNKDDILRLANYNKLGNVDFVEEKISGKTNWKDRKLAAVIDTLSKGDNLIVSELSRLGRTMLECMEILSIATQKGINVFTVKGKWRLSDSLQSKIVAVAYSMASEIERDLISQRTKEALKVRKERGVKLGRPKNSGKSKLDPFRSEIEGLLKNGATKPFIAKRYQTSVQNLYRWMSKNNIEYL
jgi:DNA invertase Pin-like site-specific DNA recombinase